MTNEQLYQGVVVVIDEKIGTDKEKTDRIGAIISKIEKKNIPCLKFRELPSTEMLNHFGAINFVVLDWLLKPVDMVEGVLLGDARLNGIYQNNINFIRSLRKFCFAPVFIFTNENIDDVIVLLKEADLYSDDVSRNFILVKKKKDLTEGNNLFKSVENWIVSSPSVYTMKMWANELSNAKSDTFWHLFEQSPIWPKILWQSFEEDSVHESSNLNDILFQLAKSRTSLMELDKKIVCQDSDQEICPDEIKQVLVGSMYLGNDKLPPRDVFPGDIYTWDDESDKAYYINIRPGCDTVVDRKGCDQKLYLLRGTPYAVEKMKKDGRYDDEYGLVERIQDVVLYGLDGNDFVRFGFKKVRQIKFDDKKYHRICRLISPYMNNVQQKYSAYTGRVALPRLPKKVVKADERPQEEKKSSGLASAIG